MKYFEDENGRKFAFEENGSQDRYITEEMVRIDAPTGISEAEIISGLRRAVSDHINGVAVGFGFDSILTAVTYADERADPISQELGIALREWRSLCWGACRELLSGVQDGDPIPGEADIISSLPLFSR